MENLDDRLFDALNSAPDYHADAELSPHLYGDYEVERNRSWFFKYDDLEDVKLEWQFKHRFSPETPPAEYEDEDGKMHNELRLTYDRWQPKGEINTDKLPIVILLHGVPVSRVEWYGVARILSRFCIVYTVDLLGMGGSSKPLGFPWTHSWNIQGQLFVEFLNGAGRHSEEPREQFLRKILKKKISQEFQDPERQIFLGGNDWGAGPTQRAVNMIQREGITKVKGFILGSAIALNGYWGKFCSF